MNYKTPKKLNKTLKKPLILWKSKSKPPLPPSTLAKAKKINSNKPPKHSKMEINRPLLTSSELSNKTLKTNPLFNITEMSKN